jgi:hypothetical protein
MNGQGETLEDVAQEAIPVASTLSVPPFPGLPGVRGNAVLVGLVVVRRKT